MLLILFAMLNGPPIAQSIDVVCEDRLSLLSFIGRLVGYRRSLLSHLWTSSFVSLE